MFVTCKCEIQGWILGVIDGDLHRVLVVVKVTATANEGATTHVERGPSAVGGVDRVVAAWSVAVVVVCIACFGNRECVEIKGIRHFVQSY